LTPEVISNTGPLLADVPVLLPLLDVVQPAKKIRQNASPTKTKAFFMIFLSLRNFMPHHFTP
jgi:hypothetical protein